MELALNGLQNLLKSADFRIEALNTPTSPGQPQVFQIRPSTVQFLPATPTLPGPIGTTFIDIPPIALPSVDIPAFSVPTTTVPPMIDIPSFALPSVDIPPFAVPAGIQSIPILLPTAEILNAAVPVAITVVWQVEELSGGNVGKDRAILFPDKEPAETVRARGSRLGGEAAVGSVDRTSTGNGVETVETLATSLQTTVMVLPQFVDLVRDFPPPPIKTLYLSATVTLSHGNLAAKLKLTRFPITVPAIPVPTLAAFFAGKSLGVVKDEDYQFVLIVVPENSPVADLPAVRAVLKTLSDIMQTVDAIKALAGLADDVLPLPALSSLTGSAGTLLQALNRHIPSSDIGVAFATADRIGDLNNIDTIKRSFWRNDIEAEDTISSLAFIAPPGRRLLVRRHDSLSGKGMVVQTGDACIAIVNEIKDGAVAEPEAVAGLDPPIIHQSFDGPDLGNRLSSMAFL